MGVGVQAAYDQSTVANRVYRHNFGRTPLGLDLVGIEADEIPHADIWWMSPPCAPFAMRGRCLDDLDPRAASLLHLVALAGRARPRALLLENVPGFAHSRVHARLLDTLVRSGFETLEMDLCPTELGVPMRRRRRYVVATRGARLVGSASGGPVEPGSLGPYLDPEPEPGLDLDPAVIERLGASLDVVDPDRPGSILRCITRGYHRCLTGAGSFLRTPAGGIRRLSPLEIARLMGFGPGFSFPREVGRATAWRLVGNAVDVRSARHVLGLAVRALGGGCARGTWRERISRRHRRA